MTTSLGEITLRPLSFIREGCVADAGGRGIRESKNLRTAADPFMSAIVMFRQLAGESLLCGTQGHLHFRALHSSSVAKAFSDFYQIHWIFC
jgi:hypothetical protein